MIGETIKENRIKTGLSQDDLAKLLAVGRTTLYKWENNQQQPNTANIISMSSIFKCSIDELIGFNLIIDNHEKDNKKAIKHFIINVIVLFAAFVWFFLFCLMLILDTINQDATLVSLNIYFIFELLSISVFILCFITFLYFALRR